MSIFPITKTPLTIPGLVLWLDARDINNGAGNPANNAPIAAWKDKSGHGNDVSQGTSLNQPIFSSSQFNGLPAVQFDGGTQQLTSAILPQTLYTIFMVYQMPDTLTNQCVLYNGNPGADGYGYFLLSGNRTILFGGNFAKEDSAMLANLELASMSWDGSTSGLSIDGVAQTITGATAPAGFQSGTFQIGSAGAGQFLNGYICSILFYDRNLSTDEKQLLINSLANDWGISV